MIETPTDRRGHPLFWLLLVMTLILTGWALKAAAAVAIPLFVAFFIAIALAPVDAWVRERMPRGGRWLGHLVSMLILILLLGAFFTGIGLAARQVVQKFPGQVPGVGQMIEQTATPDDGSGDSADPGKAPPEGSSGTGGEPGAGGEATGATGDADAATAAGDGRAPAGSFAGGGTASGRVLDRLGNVKEELGEAVRQRGTQYAGTVLNRTVSFVASLVLVLFLALLLLIEMPHWREKIGTVFTQSKENQWLQALEQTARNLRIFVVAKTAVGLATALLYVGWMAVMGLDLLLVWGVLTFLLSYVPVIGSVVAGVIAAGYAFFQLDLYWAIVTGLGLLAIEQVMGNLVEPRFLGRQLSLSSFIVLVSLLVWGWLWGLAGALLATPMLILILNVAAHVGSLRPVAVVLSEHGETSVRSVHAEENTRVRS